jgi:catechol 2,3-dioxygenase-like lactoylglutathione lyase family enzyme
MQTQEIHRGRLIDHVHLIANDLEKTKQFYAAVLGALGRKI